jgi:muramoyltetrapeptide carboxypeptidase
LFIEDVNTKPYQIDRMLMQLKLAGKFNAVRAFIFGEMLGCIQPSGQDYSLRDVILSVLSDLQVPIAFGLRSGHVSKPWNVTLPIGMPVNLEVAETNATLKGI